MNPPALSPKTQSMYRHAQERFTAWCLKHNAPRPPTEKEAGEYLAELMTTHGAPTVRLHLAAIANLFRTSGYKFDTADPAIRSVMEQVSGWRGEGVGDPDSESVDA